eukprot:scaffold23052_cov129-Skeletonema_dohrnii-CCMP3373.AAC.3
MMKKQLISFLLLSNLAVSSAWRCGSDFGGKTCADGGYEGYCCSSAGWCGTTEDYCGVGCQSGACGTTPPNFNYCGSSWGNAKQCGKSCYGGTNAECGGQTCFANVNTCQEVSPPNPGNRNYCGVTWKDANNKCSQSCYEGTDGECSTPGQKCWADVIACSVVSPPSVPMSLRGGAESDTQMMLDAETIANEEQDQFIGDNTQDMGVTGSGGPWYIWVIIGVAVLALIVCFIACRCHYKKKNKVAQEDDDKALDQPLIA